MSDQEWKDAVIDALMLNFALSEDNINNPRRAIADLVRCEVKMALDPQISKEAKDLVAVSQQRVRELEEALRDIVESHDAYCDRYISVSAHSHELANIARAALKVAP